MPTYVYRCELGHEFDELQTIHEAPLTECRDRHAPPEGDGGPCGAPCRRVICAPAFSFKGGAPTPRFHGRG